MTSIQHNMQQKLIERRRSQLYSEPLIFWEQLSILMIFMTDLKSGIETSMLTKDVNETRKQTDCS